VKGEGGDCRAKSKTGDCKGKGDWGGRRAPRSGKSSLKKERNGNNSDEKKRGCEPNISVERRVDELGLI